MQDNLTKTKVERQNPPLNEQTTYHFGNRSFIVEPVFKEECADTLGEVLLRLMKAESEKK